MENCIIKREIVTKVEQKSDSFNKLLSWKIDSRKYCLLNNILTQNLKIWSGVIKKHSVWLNRFKIIAVTVLNFGFLVWCVRTFGACLVNAYMLDSHNDNFLRWVLPLTTIDRILPENWTTTNMLDSFDLKKIKPKQKILFLLGLRKTNAKVEYIDQLINN